MADLDSLLILNGINGTTGEYLSRFTVESALHLAIGSSAGERHLADLSGRAGRDQDSAIRARYGIDTRDLSATGWGVIFASDEDPSVIEALEPLLAHRRNRVLSAGNSNYYRELSGTQGHRPGENKFEFLERHKVPIGSPADPERMPYYLLIVGDPERIPFQFQYELAVEYAVGRLHFRSADDYGKYASSVVSWELSVSRAPRRAVFFGTRSPDDPATKLSSTRLVVPLAKKIKDKYSSWQIDLVEGDLATKQRLASEFASMPPAFLFTATHGMGFDADDPRLIGEQGALLCSDWPGPHAHRGRIPNEYYFSASDVPSGTDLRGMIAFHFACYGAGTPATDDFPESARLGTPATQIAPHAFLAALPTRVLSQDSGAALAIVGHVERAWTYSFLMGDGTPQTEVFEEALVKLMDGYPIGAAMEAFSSKYASLAASLTGKLKRLQSGLSLSPDELLETLALWTMHNDARNYVIAGDPAVRVGL